MLELIQASPVKYNGGGFEICGDPSHEVANIGHPVELCEGHWPGPVRAS